MSEIKIKTRLRENTGKKSTRKVRDGSEIPAVLYGHKKEPLHLSIPHHDFRQILHHATSEHLILTVEIEGSDSGEVLTLVRDVQHHPVTGDILHVDFQRIARDEKIKVGVPVNLTGIAKGVKEFGGILDHGVREVMISTTPTMIPKELEIDVSHLDIGDGIYISDLKAKYGEIEFLDDSHVSLAHVSAPKKLELAVPAAGEEPGPAVAPEEGEGEAAAETEEEESS